ncbi:hypothetical protein BDW75DRAFT_236725 [Aspergillus navahoensis]
MYFPLINLLNQQCSLSSQLINPTITVYVISQAVSPAFWGPLSDTLGRCPVSLKVLASNAAASLGLTLIRSSYVDLAVLRGPQSIRGWGGPEPSICHLGGYLASLGIGQNPRFHARIEETGALYLASCRGGAILALGSPFLCIWAQLIFCWSPLLLVGWTLPETARAIVAYGAVLAQKLWRMWWDVLYKRKNNQISDETAIEDTITITTTIVIISSMPQKIRRRHMDSLKLLFLRGIIFCQDKPNPVDGCVPLHSLVLRSNLHPFGLLVRHLRLKRPN